MLHIKRIMVAGSALAMLAGATGAAAQDNGVVGPPQLRDFRLPGERQVTPDQPPAESQPPAQRETPRRADPPAEQRPAAPAPVQPRASEPPRPSEPPQGRDTAPAPAPAQPAPAPQPAPSPAPDSALPEAALEQPLTAEPPAAPLPTPAEAPAAAAPEEGGAWWPYLLAVLVAGGIFLLWRRRKPTGTETSEATAEAAPAVPAAKPDRPLPKPRPWIELEFKPERASATATEASVQFELIVRNSGGSAARNVRIEARMFNAGREQDKEIGAFFRRPAAEASKSTLPALDAESETHFRSIVTMPRDAMRAVTVQGRTLFVPMVAFNVFYEWDGNRSGQTSRSYVVGRELEQPAERMAPFRLDLGPRIYRTVGQREHSLARRV